MKLAAVLTVLLPGLSSALPPLNEPVHWAYSSFLGTGWYKLDGDRQVFVFRIPPRWYFRQSSIDESGQRTTGIEFHFPLTFGLHRLEGFGDFVDFDNIGTISFNPGVEVEYPVSERWRLRAYTHLGVGMETDSGESAWIYDAGLKSHYGFQHGNLTWAIINEIFFSGYNSHKSGKDNLDGMMSGLDFSYPLNPDSWGGRALKLDWNIGYRWYGNNLAFVGRTNKTVSVDDEWEIGVAMARQDGPIRVWFLKFEHVGLSYRFNSQGNFRAIALNFHAPFTR